ncbi:hypothetical protein BD310DRAFT_230350 [Dichomitus squalens]|uniref:Uncharacterized protein n=1 Tax=Dichomitus squalens TaxID=114155 RepID=A0A4Q9PCF7_9APHY|nr:hypothetical protein BD310DRAFT_230350 [Dichomitus squalens]
MMRRDILLACMPVLFLRRLAIINQPIIHHFLPSIMWPFAKYGIDVHRSGCLLLMLSFRPSARSLALADDCPGIHSSRALSHSIYPPLCYPIDPLSGGALDNAFFLTCAEFYATPALVDSEAALQLTARPTLVV